MDLLDFITKLIGDDYDRGVSELQRENVGRKRGKRSKMDPGAHFNLGVRYSDEASRTFPQQRNLLFARAWPVARTVGRPGV
jgi:hypothetical protein